MWTLAPVSTGSRQPLHGKDFLIDPYGDRVGRRVHVVVELLKLMPVNGSTVEWGDTIYSKRNKGCKRQRKISKLPIKNDKLGKTPIVSLEQSWYQENTTTRSWSFNPDRQGL